MHSNKRGLALLLALLLVAALVYVIKNQRNNPGSFETTTQQAKIESKAGENANTDAGSGDNRVVRGEVRLSPNLR